MDNRTLWTTPVVPGASEVAYGGMQDRSSQVFGFLDSPFLAKI